MSAIAFNDVTVELGKRPILSGVSFAVEPGEFVGVMGPNGAGKTTMMRAILGLLPVASGTIDVLGQPPRRGNAAIGYVPQSRRTPQHSGIMGSELLVSAYGGERWGFPWSTTANRKAVDAALDRVGASGLARRPIAELSGGERQRIAIARALYGQPAILVLDEASSALDDETERQIMDGLRSLAHDLTIIAVTHRRSSIQPGDQVVRLLAYSEE